MLMETFLWGVIGLLAFIAVAGVILKNHRRNKLISNLMYLAGVLFLGGIAKFNTGIVSWLGWFYLALLFCFFIFIISRNSQR